MNVYFKQFQTIFPLSKGAHKCHYFKTQPTPKISGFFTSPNVVDGYSDSFENMVCFIHVSYATKTLRTHIYQRVKKHSFSENKPKTERKNDA